MVEKHKQDSPKTKEFFNKALEKKLLRRKKIMFGIVIILVGIGILRTLVNYTPTSSIQWRYIDDIGISLTESCKESKQIYPPTSPPWPFPVYSPDNNYYIEVDNGGKMETKWIKFYQIDSKKEIGIYYSSLSSLIIHCWDKDSSGVYVSDYKPGTGSLFIPFSTGGKIGLVKKLLVPE